MLVRVAETRGALNIFELFPSDLQMFILTFLSIQDLYRVSLSCQHGASLVVSPEADHFVWQSVAKQLLFNNNHEAIQEFMQERKKKQMTICTGGEDNIQKADGEDEMTKATDDPPNMWRDLVREASMIKWDPGSRTPDSDIIMHNNNRTISCERRTVWDTIRTNKKLGMGTIHCWEYTLDDHDNSGYNIYRIFVGIERATQFTHLGSNKIVGLGSRGIGYNLGAHTVHREKPPKTTSILKKQQFKFSTGDTIAIKLDLKNLSRSKTASMHLFKNNEYFHTVSNIATKNINYYPAISVIGRQKVSIRMKHPSLCKEKSN